MSMINLREAPLVDKPEDGATLFALNPDGTINRISAKNVGGSGGDGRILWIDVNTADKDLSTNWEVEVDIGCTYEEFKDKIASGALLWMYFCFPMAAYSGRTWYFDVYESDDAMVSDVQSIDGYAGVEGYYQFVCNKNGARIIFAPFV